MSKNSIQLQEEVVEKRNEEVRELQEEMKSQIRNELNYSELVIDSSVPYQDGYHLQMIRENTIPGLLQVTACANDNCGRYIYNITGMTSLQRYYEKTVIDKQEIQRFLNQLCTFIDVIGNYMLDVNCILLDVNYIFCKNQEFYFCYYPDSQKSLSVSFHELSEYWVKNIDYGNYTSVAFVCGIHKESMEENYNLEELIEEYMTETKPREEILNESKNWNMTEEQEVLQMEGELWKTVDESIDSVDKSNKRKNIFRETSMAKYWEQKKKEKWGSWDDLLSQEESFIMDKKKKI